MLDFKGLGLLTKLRLSETYGVSVEGIGKSLLIPGAFHKPVVIVNYHA